MRNKMCDMMAILSLVVIGIFSLTLWNVDAFNIESKHYTFYRRESNSMFGFSVAQYRDRNSRGWVIVGAPEAQTSQKNVYRGGAVYKCDYATDNSCVVVEFDTKENTYAKNPSLPDNYVQIDNKTLQWFGATVSTSQQDGGPILACAPRYVFFSVSPSKQESEDGSKSLFANRRDPVGTCWVVTNLTSSKQSNEFSPCRTRHYGYHRQGSCQAGLGASVSKDGERIFVGAPGSWYWQGQLYSIMRRLENIPYLPPGNESFGVFPGQIYQQMSNNRGKVMFTKEGSAEEDDSYLGYSVTSGDFIGNGDSGTAVGMPRGYGLHGKVLLLTSDMKNHQNITGEQMGGYFGYSLATGDIDGDGLDDLIIGAPMYTIPDNPEMNIETGRIYVFYGKGPNKYWDFAARDGESNRGRFGLSLASLGDIDRDGCGDFAVGAPYAGAESRGAVYIYHGTREGVSEKYSQVIHAEDLSDRVKTFGFSINGGLDLDGNKYPDMVVGSYESDTAMFFRSRPVIKMKPEDTFVEFSSATKLISLDDKNCTLSDTTRVTCLELRACFKYTGDGVSSNYNFNVQYVLDVKKSKNPRMFFIEHEGRNTQNQTILVDRDQQFCRTVRVYVTPSIRDKLTSLDAEMRMSLYEDRFDDGSRNIRLPLKPVLATTSSRKDSLTIRKNCGSDDICTPDLQLTATPNVYRYLLGSENRLELDILVKNTNEDAFEATFNLPLPAGVDYIKIERIDKTEIPVQCSAPKQSNNNTLRCDIGNPLPMGNVVHFKVLLQPFNVHDKSSYNFTMFVNSTNPEPALTIADNSGEVSVEIWVDANLIIEGESKPKDLYYNPENYTDINVTTDVEYGPAFIHNYTIRNQGPSTIEEGEILLVWPAATLAGDDFVYLLEQPETSGPLICASANANPLSLKLEQRKRLYQNYPSSGIVHQRWTGQQNTLNVHTGFEAEKENSGSQRKESHDNRYKGIADGSQVLSSSRRVSTAGESGQSGYSRHASQSGESDYSRQLNQSGQSENSGESGYSRHFGQKTVSSEEQAGQIAIRTESGSSSLGVGDASLGVVTSGRDTNFFGKTDTMAQNENGGLLITQNENSSNRGGFAQGEQTFIEKNETHTVQGTGSSIDDRFTHRGGVSTTVNITKLENDRYLELRKAQQEQQQRNEEQRIILEKRREEERRIKLREEQIAQRRRQEETEMRRKQQQDAEEKRRRQQQQYEEEERRRQQQYEEEERRRQGEEDIVRRRNEDKDEEEQRRIKEEEDGRDYDEYENEKDYEDDSQSSRGFTNSGNHDGIVGDREEAVKASDFGFQLRNITSAQDLQKFLSTLKNTIGYEVYDRQGIQHLQFLGRYRISSDGKEYIEFKDGSIFPLQNRYREQSYSSQNDASQDRRYLKINGQIITGEDGKAYCRLDDDRRFPLQGSSSYSVERTSSVNGGAHANGETSYAKSWTSESANRESTAGREIETYESRSHEERRTSSRKQDVKMYNKNSDFNQFDTQKPSYVDRRSRLKRNSGDDFDGSNYLGNQESKVTNDEISQFCTSNKCVSLRCTLGRLEKDQEVSISARFRIKGTTLKKNALDTSVKTSTQLISRVTKLPFVGKPSRDIMKNHEVNINITPSAPAPGPDPVPLWIVVLSACAGTIILLLLIYLLHKCGFFKRNRPVDAPERQPLNRNGHFNGDDHL